MDAKHFVTWLESGGFDIGEYRKKKGTEIFDICTECVMATYLRSLGIKNAGCGNTLYWLRGEDDNSNVELPTWAQKVVAKFDELSTTAGQKDLVKALVKVATAC